MTHPTITKEQVDALLKTLAPVREPEFWTKLCQAAYKLGRNAGLEEARLACKKVKTAVATEWKSWPVDAGTVKDNCITAIESLKDNTPATLPDWMRDDAEDEQALMDRDMGDN